jgi:long-chain-fatty-acid--[acyl-carrier-protein] ligase
MAIVFTLLSSAHLQAEEERLPVQKYCELHLSLGEQVRQAPARGDLDFARRWLQTRYSTHFDGSASAAEIAEMRRLASEGKGFLLISEHPGPIDPILLTLALSEEGIYPRPIMDENLVKAPLVGRLIRYAVAKVSTILVPLGTVGGKTQASLISGIINEGVNTLRAGGSVLFYPSGRIKRESVEHLNSASMLTEFLVRQPNVPVFMIRQRGLWGSRMTLGSPSIPEGQTSNAKNLLLSGATQLPLALAVNLGELPKRDITYTVRRADPSMLKANAKKVDENNLYVEAFFNDREGNPENRTFVPLWPWQRSLGTHELPKVNLEGLGVNKQSGMDDSRPVEAHYIEAVADSYRRLKGLDKQQAVAPSTSMENVDSLDQVMFFGTLEDKYNVTFPAEKSNATNLRDVAAMLEALMSGPSDLTTETLEMSTGWNANSNSKKPLEIAEGETVTEKFINHALQNPNMVISEGKDAMSYKKLLTTAIALSYVLERQFRNDRIGILFPAHEKLPLVYHAVAMAGKIPVLMDFTGSPTFLEKMFEGDEKILTSKVIVNQVGKDYDLSHILHRFVYVEDLKLQIAAQMLRAKYMMQFPALPHERGRRTQTAAVLFTSGSSGDPKEVSITQEMMLANMSGVVELLNSGSRTLITENLRLLNFLPPFHSFGHFFLNLQLSFGIPTIYHPKATDFKELVKLIRSAGITAYAATPTFAEGIARAGTKADLASVELIILGAEAPKEAQIQMIKSAFTNPNLVILCGYGMTEASPVISVNIPGHNDLKSVGFILPNIDYLIVDPETLEPTPAGQEGELLVAGPSLFNGYGNHPEYPFVMLKGRDGQEKRFVHTKDLVVEGPGEFRGGEIDKGTDLMRGLIYVKGRLDDQIKRGGDKIQPPALEDDFAEYFNQFKKDDDLGTNFAISTAGDNKELVLFTTIPGLNFEKLLELQNGRPGREKINRIAVIPEIPVIGATKKINRKALRQHCKKHYNLEWPTVR